MSLFDDFCNRVSAGRIQCQRGLCIAAGTQLALPQQFLRQLVILSFFHVMAKEYLLGTLEEPWLFGPLC